MDMVAASRPAVANTYARSVLPQGNLTAQAVMARVFHVADAEWRGLGCVPASGLAIKPEYARYDARIALPAEVPAPRAHTGCRCGEVLRGTLDPPDCALFGRACTPARPIGPCMVSAEGACAAWHQYGRSLD